MYADTDCQTHCGRKAIGYKKIPKRSKPRNAGIFCIYAGKLLKIPRVYGILSYTMRRRRADAVCRRETMRGDCYDIE